MTVPNRTSQPRITFDAGALIALERHDPRVRAIVDRVHANGDEFLIPAAVVAQVWRAGARSVTTARLLKSSSARVVALDERAARSAGVLLGLVGQTDVVDASVVICARQYGTPVLTSDPDDLLQLDPTLRVVPI